MINNRRRVLRVMAVGAGALMAPHSLWATGKSVEFFEWHGRALGADTSIQLYSFDKQKAQQALAGAQDIISKYEAMFSLYDENSQTSKLNKFGVLYNPSSEFVALVMLSKRFSNMTNGAFDISVQPLWDVYQNHFNGQVTGDLDEKITAVLENIGSDKIRVDNESVSFDRDKMAISFNGIAQGYITDQVTEFLNERGFDNILVDMGEYRAGGPQGNGEPWRIGLLDPFDTVSVAEVIEMSSGAVATSGGYGNQFGPSGRYHHLFNPQTGLSSNLYASVTVQADDATTADALSTAFSNMTMSSIKKVLGKQSNVQMRVTDPAGTIHALRS